MGSKISFAWSVCIISIAGIACSLLIVFFPTPPDTPIVLIENIIVPKQVIAELPARLIIPTIHVNAFVEYVGLTPSGAMGVPQGPDDVAWFDLGSRPGSTGSAVVAGHEGWKDNIPAVFDNLHKLQKDDLIYIVDQKGATSTFIVVKTGIYDQNANSSTVFDSTDGQAHLNLITCEGIWNAAEKSYSNRIVIFADKEIK